MSETKDSIAKALGALWIFDGFLQFQPAMLGQAFATNVLALNLIAQPHWVYEIVSFGISLWNLNPALNDLGVALLQVAIGLAFLFSRSDILFKIGAWTSIVWGIIVWLCGEGAGLLLTGTASFYTGAPGAVLLYVLLAALLLAPKVQSRVFVWIAAATFILGGLLQLQSAFWSIDGVQATAMAAAMEPIHALNTFPIYISHLLSINPVFSNWILVLIPLAIGFWLLIKPNRTAGIVALIFLIFVWWIGQDFGMLSTFPTGVATDPETAPLLALFLLPIFWRRAVRA